MNIKEWVDKVKNAWDKTVQWERDNADPDGYDKYNDYR